MLDPIAFARSLRQKANTPEKTFWEHVRNRRFRGLTFRRQASIGPYFADFYCAEKQLIVEIDGDTHFYQGAEERDAKRDAFLREQGLHVLRFTNTQVKESLDWVLETIGDFVDVSPSP